MIAGETNSWSKYSGDAIKIAHPPVKPKRDYLVRLIRRDYLKLSCINHTPALMYRNAARPILTLDPNDVKRFCRWPRVPTTVDNSVAWMLTNQPKEASSEPLGTAG
jgi:hypothetical protein